MNLFSVPEFKSVLKNPDKEKLRELAKKDEQTTEFGSPNYVGKIRSRSAKFTKNSVDHKFEESDLNELKKARSYLEREGNVIQMDRKIGGSESFHCRLFVSKEYARIALGWSELLEEIDSSKKPDMVTVMVPDWNRVKVLVEADKAITFALGSDYIGEAKKAFLRMWMYLVKKKGWIGLHAGSKLLHLKEGERVKKLGQLYFGLSATGKSTLTGHGFYLKEPEKAELIQDDVVGLKPSGECFGTEGKGLFIKTEGLTKREQPELFHAVTQKNAVLENVFVDESGRVDFFNDSLTSNGRAAIQRSELRNASNKIDLDKADHLFFITRNPLMPPIAKLEPEKGAVAFMLGESVESSAGDPSKAGQRVRVVGTNPFIMGSKGKEGNRLFEFLSKNKGLECYILNTGTVGEGKGKKDIRVKDTVNSIKRASRKKINWALHEELNLLVPKKTINSEFDPSTHYPEKEFKEKLSELREERKKWLEQFPELKPSIKKHLY